MVGSANNHLREIAAVPVVSAIINGEKKHGVTMHYIDEGVDSGDIIAQREVEIAQDDTGYDLFRKCEFAGHDLFKEAFPLVIQGRNRRIPQDHSAATTAKRSDIRGGECDLSWDEGRLYNFVRALTFPPYRPAYMIAAGKRIFLTTQIQTPP